MSNYGQLDATYKAAGEEQGICQLVDHFYDIMELEYPTIWHMHTRENAELRDRLTRFLCGWTGGPRLYKERYGQISIPGAHRHLPITEAERDQWLECMAKALERTDYPTELKSYLLKALSVPAERITEVCKIP